MSRPTVSVIGGKPIAVSLKIAIQKIWQACTGGTPVPPLACQGMQEVRKKPAGKQAGLFQTARECRK